MTAVGHSVVVLAVDGVNESSEYVIDNKKTRIELNLHGDYLGRDEQRIPDLAAKFARRCRH